MADEFGGGTVSVQAEHCLNARYKAAGCQLCADDCPTGAIGLPAGQPRLEPDLCVSCGLCLHACPTNAFSQPHAPEAALVQSAVMQAEDALALACPQHADPALSRAPVSAVGRHSRCLAALSVSQLLEISDCGRRAVWLDDSRCADCPIGRAQPVIARTVTVANRLLEAFSSPQAIHTHLGSPGALADQPHARSVIDGDQPVVSRRDLFGRLGHLTRQTAATVIAESLATPPATGPLPVDQRLPHRIPPSRGRLFSQLKCLGQPADVAIATADIPFAAVVVDADACSACALCARFCPTGALCFEDAVERFTLTFTPAICIDCGICALACPEDAVGFDLQMPARHIVQTEPQPGASGPLAPCSRCGVPTAGSTGESRPTGASAGESRPTKASASESCPTKGAALCYVCRACRAQDGPAAVAVLPNPLPPAARASGTGGADSSDSGGSRACRPGL